MFHLVTHVRDVRFIQAGACGMDDGLSSVNPRGVVAVHLAPGGPSDGGDGKSLGPQLDTAAPSVLGSAAAAATTY